VNRPYLVTQHTEDHTSRHGRTRSRVVTTQWHMPVTLAEATERIVTDHAGRNIREVTA
jgi:hypothetical protein